MIEKEDKAKRSVSSFIDVPLAELIAEADKNRRDYAGSTLEVCSIINAKSGLCGEDCKFCAQSLRHSTGVAVYPLKDRKTIVEAARAAKKIGAEKFGIVTSGNRLSAKELDIVSSAVSEIRNDVGISVCGSLGDLSRKELEILKNAGLVRYHHNIETSPNFYKKVVSTHSFQERITTIAAAKEAGLEVCSGGIIGMGESWQDRIDMAYVLKELNVDSVPLNLLVPVSGTPFESLEPISCNDALRTLCIFRIILKDKVIKIAAGRETILKDFQGAGFMAGANGMLTGGYLTIKGRSIGADREFIEEIKKIWKG